DDKGASESTDSLSMTPAIPCRTIAGFEDYEALDDPALTKDEKLLIYYHPIRYKYEKLKDGYHMHLTQDFRIRRRGEKAVLQTKDNMVKYEVRTKRPPANVYIQNYISLKALSPGEYDLDIILHDRVGKGRDALQTVKFRVKPSPSDPTQKDEKGEDPEKPES